MSILARRSLRPRPWASSEPWFLQQLWKSALPANNVNRNILLISNSTLHGSGFLDHAETEIRDFLGQVRRVLFVPFALKDQDGYAARVRDRLKLMGYDVESIHQAADKQKAVSNAESIFIGGGNTFRLLKSLYEFDVINLIRKRA